MNPPNIFSQYKSPRLGTMVGLSAVLHFIVLFVFTSFSFSIPKKDYYYRPVYQVDLVSLPRQKTVTPKEKKISSPSKKPVHKLVPKVKKKVSRKKIIKPKKTVISKEKKTESKKPVMKKAEEKKELNETDYLVKALDRIKKSSSKKNKSSGQKEALSSKIQSSANSQYQLSSSEYANLHFNIYYNKVWERIRSEWVLPGDMTEENWEATVSIRISKSGHIVDSVFEKRSGNIYFDQSAIRAINKADPLPPLPLSYTKKYLDIGIRFHSLEYRNG
ncbi:MAG: energy transducer TonB [Thermodesulfobacteriota bacterium]|nr:energy transducer TonB [Thermodesulfobacteriota bacterium]